MPSKRQGADTALWLAATKPDEVEDKVRLDRKPPRARIYAATRQPWTSAAKVVEQLARGSAGAARHTPW